MEETEYEENFDASKVTIVYDGNEEQLPQGNGDLTEQKLGKSEAAVWSDYAGWKTALCVWLWYVFSCV